MQLIFAIVLLSTGTLLGCASTATGPTLPKHEIGVSDIRFADNMPIGLLGKPLGTRVVVEGARARVLTENPIAVAKVDGHPLPQDVCLELSGIEQLQESTTYKLEGYESGAFAGDPEWLNPAVQQPFQYRPSFVVTRVIEPIPQPRPAVSSDFGKKECTLASLPRPNSGAYTYGQAREKWSEILAAVCRATIDSPVAKSWDPTQPGFHVHVEAKGEVRYLPNRFIHRDLFGSPDGIDQLGEALQAALNHVYSQSIQVLLTCEISNSNCEKIERGLFEPSVTVFVPIESRPEE